MKRSTQEKLALFKKKIANLSEAEMNNVVGGLEADITTVFEKSTIHEFTCNWCTHTSNQSDAGKCEVVL